MGRRWDDYEVAMRVDTSRFTRMHREAFEAVRRVCSAPLGSVRLREEIGARVAS